nr:unnamed protein product [Digitaria exilis]
MADAQGLIQFLGAMAELARGALAPTVPPVWERELLEGRSRPQAAIVEDDMDEVPDCCDINGSSSSIKLSVDNKMSLCSLFFGPREIAAIPAQLLPDIQKHVSNFDIIAGWLWKFGTVAMAPDSNEVMSLVMAVDARGRKTTKAADNTGGEDGIVVPVCLPAPAMNRLVEEMGKLHRAWVDDETTLQQPLALFPVIKRSAL